ncbi:BTAD domain-containing putative transcriptional regulator [Streptomyces sp. P1-3]|uniref:AfsR/SARP family transcriptional regulator n=1 Tax=Streptomyces sp. P1-3 TaxID=3421658 RepID=UPI003D36AFA8
MLACLLVAEGEVMSVARLVDAVWGPTPPATAEKQIKNSISDLRKQLSGAGVDVETVPPGYRLRIRCGETDLQTFRRRIALAREHVARGGRKAEAIVEYRNALTLCCGQVLSNVHSEFIDSVAATFSEEQLVAYEECIELELDSGRHRMLVAELMELVEANPHREGLVCCLMRALAELGERARALAVYDRARQVLSEEFHTEPGSRLRGLCARIRVNELAPRPEGLPHGPSTLPPDVPHLVGRAAELGAIVAAARTATSARSAHGGTVVIDGMPGVGKTALTIRAARELASDYRDAQLFLDMGAHTGDGASMSPTTALGHLLVALGIPSQEIPAGLQERAALWRASLRTRRAVIVLDDVASSAQVRPLLPDGANCLVLISSRHRLAGLDGVRTVSLDVLSVEQGRSLFSRALGDARSEGEPAEARAVVRLCGGLPLAILIAAARLRHRPNWTVADLAGRLSDGDGLLDELCAEDRSVASRLLSSYQRLAPELQRFFRSLGQTRTERIDVAEAAALAGISGSRAEQGLEALADRHFVEPTVPGIYRMHGLVRACSQALAGRTLTRVRPVEPVERYADDRGGVA